MTKSNWWSLVPNARTVAKVRLATTVLFVVMILLHRFAPGGGLFGASPLLEAVLDALIRIVTLGMGVWWGEPLWRFLHNRESAFAEEAMDRNRVTEQKNRQLQATLQAFRSMTAVLDIKQVGNVAVEQVLSHTPFQKACLILGPDDHGNYVLAGSTGLSEEYLGRFLAAIVGSQKAATPVEWCQLTRQPVIVENLARDFRTTGLADLYNRGNLEGMIAVPLLAGDECRGILAVFTECGTPFSTADLSLISALANQSAIALENARLYSLSVDNRNRMDKAMELLRTVAGALNRMHIGLSPLLHMLAEGAATIFAPARVRMVLFRSGRTEPVVVEEEVGMGAGQVGTLVLSLPVSLDGEKFGRFDLFLPGEGRVMEADEVQILQALALMTASALANASMATEMRMAFEKVERSYIGTLEALSKALELRDYETEGHSRRVVQYTLALAQRLELSEEELIPIMRGALLHDVGKIGIPDAILRKPAPLTKTEWSTMMEHPRIGYEMLRQIDFLKLAAPIILHHHERFDGKGYPAGLSGESIPLGARIFAVADAYDAITSDRPYRKGQDHGRAVAEVIAAKGTQFDPKIVEAFLSLPDRELERIRQG